MPKTYYDSELTGAQIEDALEAIHGVVTPSNNGKVLCIVNGAIAAKSASEWGHGAVLESLSVTANGDYTPPTGTDGFDSVHVAVPGATLTTKSITQNGTYNASQDDADGYSSVTVNVSGGGSAVVQPLSVTQNGTYNPPSGVDGFAPVTVNVSGGGGSAFRASTKTVGGTDASLNIYVDEMFVEAVVYTEVSAGLYKDYDFVRVMYNVPAAQSPDGIAHTGWCVFAKGPCVSNNASYSANQLVREWGYNEQTTCVALLQ